MLSKLKSFLNPDSFFLTLPNRKKFFRLNGFSDQGYLIPDMATEQRLYKKTLWVRGFSILLFTPLVALGSILIIEYNEQFWRTYNIFLLAILLFFSIWLQNIVYKNDLSKLQKIDSRKFIQDYLSDIKNKLRITTNNSLPNYNINGYFDIPNSDDKIIFLSYSEQFPNIIRCSSDGNIVWQSELPNKNDVYTNLKWENNNLVAFSQSCQSVILDLSTGKIVQ